jgi:hypothetical protein
MLLDLTKEEIDLIIQSLGTKPWGQVNSLIVKIIEQVNKEIEHVQQNTEN